MNQGILLDYILFAAERKFSAMRVLKNWLRTATATPRLSNLNVLYFYSDANFNTRQITVDFFTKYGRDGTDLFQSYLDRKKEQMEANV